MPGFTRYRTVVVPRRLFVGGSWSVVFCIVFCFVFASTTPHPTHAQTYSPPQSGVPATITRESILSDPRLSNSYPSANGFQDAFGFEDPFGRPDTFAGEPPITVDANQFETWSITDTPEVPVDRFRRGFFQGGELRGGYLVDGGGQARGLDETMWEASLAFGVPLGSLKNILVVQPFFRTDHLDGPTQVDAPATLYSTGANFFQRKQWNERISTIVIVTPSVRSDFTTSDNAFRLFGLGLVNWQCREDLSLGLGAVYLDRADLGVLPAVGLTWTPTPSWKIDLMMPRPQINRRLWKDGGFAEGWAFAGATLGGNTWAVTREAGPTAGQSDELTLTGIRLFAGYEKFQTGNRGWKLETGYVFNRSIEYENDGTDLNLADAVFIEATWKF